MGDQQLVNSFLQWVSDQSGISNLERSVSAKYDLIFNPKEIIPKFNDELKALKIEITKKGTEYYQALEEQAQSDARLANVDLKTRLQFVGQRLLPEMQSAVRLLNEKYPGVLKYLTGNDAKSISKRIIKTNQNCSSR